LKLQTVQRIPAVPKDERDTIFHEHFPQIDTVDPNAPPANPEKKKAWNLDWGPLSRMADMSAQQPVTRFSLDLWMSFFCRSIGAPILMLQAYAVVRTMCSCKNFSVRVNHKVSTTVAANNKQVIVELVNFGLVGSNNLVIDVLICCDHIGNSTVKNRHLNSKMHANDYL